MKALLLLVLVLVGVWLWRMRRHDSDNKLSKSPPEQPLDMVRCSHCGLHLPSQEALQGNSGLYCCQEHLRLAEQ